MHLVGHHQQVTQHGGVAVVRLRQSGQTVSVLQNTLNPLS